MLRFSLVGETHTPPKYVKNANWEVEGLGHWEISRSTKLDVELELGWRHILTSGPPETIKTSILTQPGLSRYIIPPWFSSIYKADLQ